MKYPIVIFLILIISSDVQSQNYWEKVPANPEGCYSGKDNYESSIQALKRELKSKQEEEKQKNSQSLSNISAEQMIALAKRYQKLTPEEIEKMQNEQLNLVGLQSSHQKLTLAYDEKLKQLESQYRAESYNKLNPIKEEYLKLPDGEGAPQWAIKKGAELLEMYDKEYEVVCIKYFSSPNALFKIWLKDYKEFLVDKEVSLTRRVIEEQFRQYGITPDDSISTVLAVEKYIKKCSDIFKLRETSSQR
jgi:hypothetical protein